VIGARSLIAGNPVVVSQVLPSCRGGAAVFAVVVAIVTVGFVVLVATGGGFFLAALAEPDGLVGLFPAAAAAAAAALDSPAEGVSSDPQLAAHNCGADFSLSLQGNVVALD